MIRSQRQRDILHLLQNEREGLRTKWANEHYLAQVLEAYGVEANLEAISAKVTQLSRDPIWRELFLEPALKPEVKQAEIVAAEQAAQEKGRLDDGKYLRPDEMSPQQRMLYADTGERPRRPVSLPDHLIGKSPKELLEYQNKINHERWEAEKKAKPTANNPV